MNATLDPPFAPPAQKRMTRAIIEEIYTAVESLGGDFRILSAIGSWHNSLPDEDVLANLKGWNRDNPTKHK